MSASQKFEKYLLDYVTITEITSKLQQIDIYFSLNILLASVVPSIFAVAASYAGCDETLAITFLTISIAGQAFNTAGTLLNLYDLAPNYISTLNGMVDIVQSTAALLAPSIVGILTPHVSL